MRKQVFLPALLLAIAMAASCQASPALPPNLEQGDVVEQSVVVDWKFPLNMEAFNENSIHAVTGEIISSSTLFNGSLVYTTLEVKVESAYKGSMKPGDTFSVVVMGGDVNEYEFLVAHEWDKGLYEGVDLEKAKHTTLHFPLILDVNTGIGERNLFMLADQLEEFNGCYRSLILAEQGQGLYRFKTDGAEFTVTLDEVKKIVSK